MNDSTKKLMTVLLLSMFAAACAAPPASSVNNSAGNVGGSNTNRSNSTPQLSPSPGATESVEDRGMGKPTPQLSPLQPDAGGVQAAIDVVHEYYDAINARDYRKAYELWSGKGEASGKTFEEFRDGFADTASTEIDTGGEPGTLEGAAGSQYIGIPGIITAKTTDGKDQRFWGEYVMRRSMVDGATAEQRQWRIYSAQFREL